MPNVPREFPESLEPQAETAPGKRPPYFDEDGALVFTIGQLLLVSLFGVIVWVACEAAFP